MDNRPNTVVHIPGKPSKNDRARSIPKGVSTTRNIAWNIASKLVWTIVTIILTPILIHRLGDFEYGIWALTLSLLGSYSLMDSGLRLTFQRFVARLTGKDERQGLNQIFATVMALMMGISLLALCLTPIMVFILPRFFHIAAASRPLFGWLVVLVGLSVAIDCPVRGLNNYLTGLQRFDLSNLAIITTTTIRAVLFVVALRLGYGLLGIAGVALGMEVLSLPLYWGSVRRADPDAVLWPRLFNWSCAREVLGYSFFAYLSYGGDYLRYSVDSAVIGKVLTIALVTPFSIVGRLMDNFRGIVGLFTSPLMPRMSALDGQSRTKELSDFFFRSTKLTAIISLYIGSLAILDGKSLLRVWIGERYVWSYSLLWVLALAYTVVLVQFPSASLMYAKGRHRLLGWWTLGEGLVNLVLSIFWAYKYGLIGVALGTAVPMLAIGIFIQPAYITYLLKVSPLHYFRKAFLRPFLCGGIFAAISLFAFSGQTQTKLLPFALIVIAQSVLFGILVYVIGLDRDEQREARQRCFSAAHTMRLLRTS